MDDIYALGTFSRDGEASWPGVVRNGSVLPLAQLLPGAPAALAELFDDWNMWEARIAEAMASDFNIALFIWYICY